MNKQEFLARYGLTEDQFCGKEKIESYLNLRSVTTLLEGFNPTVGGSLDLHYIKIQMEMMKVISEKLMVVYMNIQGK